MTKYILDVQQDPATEELFIQLPDKLLSEAGWSIGDTVEWTEEADGAWSLKKKDVPETEWVAVDCISTFRTRYMVEVPKGKTEWALDTVVSDDAKEFSSVHLGEMIASYRVVSKEEALEYSDIDNDYTVSWTDDLKIATFFTTLEEQAKKK